MPSSAKKVEKEPPRPGEPIWTAVENRSAIRRAVQLWERKLKHGAREIDGLGASLIWIPSQAYWGTFRFPKAIPGRRRRGNYWNAFGLVVENARQNMVVEINPPSAGSNTNAQGVIARDPQQGLWILHGGRLHPAKRHIRGFEFDDLYAKDRVVVQFADGSTFRYHRVARIDGSAQKIQADVGDFVRECFRIREHYASGKEAADAAVRVEEAERKLSPETDPEYLIKAREAIKAKRAHGTIWRALMQELHARNVKMHNDRVGRFGPDLVTIAKSNAALFEIKTSMSVAAIYEGFGQLHIYEQLLGKSYRKILVLPGVPHGPIAEALQAYRVSVLTFRKQSNRISFQRGAIDKVLLGR